MKQLFLASRFYYVMTAFIAAMMLSYPFPLLLPFVQTGLVLFALVVAIDILILFSRSVVLRVERESPQVLSLGDDNEIKLIVQNRSNLDFHAEMIDELPEQFQIRDFSRQFHLAANQTHVEKYSLRPLARGVYAFGKIHVFIKSSLRLIQRRVSADAATMLPVYPSIIQMKKYEVKAFERSSNEFGVKKIRRVGHSYEFEHIKHYIRGDDYRSINWKATGRRASLMVNQYEDEKSQLIYCVIDKSRVMHMPFNGLSLFDYAVNTALVMSNIVLSKQDKAGLITFAETPKALVKAERSKSQLKKIMEALYREKEGAVEANYESLYMTTQKFIAGRCMMMLFTNFDSTYALHRVLPQLQKLNEKHLLVVIFFENSEVSTQASANVKSLEDVYTQVTAEQFALTKIQLVQELRQAGIMSILTRPEALTVSAINKYLEVKSRGMI
jgi:uncharacterized protein (DUF58 family)